MKNSKYLFLITQKMINELYSLIYNESNIQCEDSGAINITVQNRDRELRAFIHTGEVKRFDPFKSSIYASCMKIIVAGSSTPVRFTMGPFLRVPSFGFIHMGPVTEINYVGL